jgi:hypothetical protein
MTISSVDDSATISTTEYSLPADTTTGVPTSQTDDHFEQCLIYFVSTAAGDIFEVKVYEKVLTTQRTVMSFRVRGPTSTVYVIPGLLLLNGWDITAKKIAGTDRVAEWSLRKVT